jgi:hypothetical protein
VNNKLDLSFLRSCDADRYNAIASLLRDLTENLTPLRGQTGALLQAVEGVVLCHFCRVLPIFAFSTLRHATHLLSADYINYENISIQIKDKFRVEVRHYTNPVARSSGQFVMSVSKLQTRVRESFVIYGIREGGGHCGVHPKSETRS